MDSAEVAERHALSKPGYRLLACEPAALPYFVITAPALLMQRKPVAPLEEFVLRSIADGIVTAPQVAEFLGLDSSIVLASLTRLWQRDLIEVPVGDNGRVLKLLPNGVKALAELTDLAPIEQDIWFAFDRIEWKPSSVQTGPLLQPRDIRDLGLLAIRPRKLARPDLSDLPASSVDSAIRATLRSALGDFTLLVVKRIERAEQRYLPCHILVFEAPDSNEHALEVAVDGRVEPSIGARIDQLGGADFLGIRFGPSALSDPGEAPVIVEAVDSSITAGPVTPLEEIDRIRRESTADEGVQGDDIKPILATGETRSPGIEAIDVRNIDTFEHPQYFSEARRDVRRRLLITSAWVRNGVVTKAFMDDMYRVARRGALIHIGYGIDELAGGCDERAVQNLVRLHEKFDNVVVALLGNTHAKLLIWDDTQITSSFNWLSFRGDLDRTYRQELGILVKRSPVTVDAMWKSQAEFIEAVAGKTARSSR
jgi:DNA-binding MarR family transcriptional regulator